MRPLSKVETGRGMLSDSPLIYDVSIRFFGILDRLVTYRCLVCDPHRSLEQNLYVELKPSDETLKQGRNRSRYAF
jgi:hypothetical protein